MSLRNRKKKKYLMLLLLLVLGVTVGYAFLNTTLNINGTSKISNAKWNVYWDNPQVTAGSVTETKPTIDSNKTTATFDITLNNPKDFYEFTIDAVNAGTIDAMIKVNGVSNKVYSDSGRTEETTLPDAIKYTVTYEDGGTISDKHLLAKKSGDTPTRETYKVRVEFRNDEQTTAADLEEITEETTYYMTFSVEYVQAENAVERNQSAIHYLTRQVEGQITPGDVIGIGETEDFYVISSNAEKTVLLAKYNLFVGISDNPNVVINKNVHGYGLQSIDAIGYNGYSIGTVAFSANVYWEDEFYQIASQYNANGSSYDGNPFPFVYDDTYNIEPIYSEECDNTNCYYTEGYSVAYYVNLYKNKLIEMGAPSTISGRLLSFEEVDSNRYLVDESTNSLIFFNAGTYWLGSVCSNEAALYIGGSEPDAYPICDGYGRIDDSLYFGVRPVIEIPTSELQ